MDSEAEGRTLPSLLILLPATFLLYRIALAVYRLKLHPLAKFPGPSIAAETSLYEAYHEIVLNGQYSAKISELHDRYGTWSVISYSYNSRAKRSELIQVRPHHSSYPKRAAHPGLELLRRVLW
jgi:hypothetical protein